MKVWHWQQLGLPIGEPLHPRQPLTFGTVTVAAGVVSDARCATIIALFNMAAERGRSAGRDGAHDAPLDAPEMTGVHLSKRCAVAAEDIRHLQGRSHDGALVPFHSICSVNFATTSAISGLTTAAKSTAIRSPSRRARVADPARW